MILVNSVKQEHRSRKECQSAAFKRVLIKVHSLPMDTNRNIASLDPPSG